MNNSLIHEGRAALAAVLQFCQGAILAGGYLRDVMLGAPAKDIDIFVPTLEASQVNYLVNNMKATTDTASAYMDSGEVMCIWSIPGYALPVQVIELRPGLSPVERVAHHDFGICQIWHDGDNLLTTPSFDADAAAKTFTLVHSESPQETARSLRRWERLRQKFTGWTLVVPPWIPEASA